MVNELNKTVDLKKYLILIIILNCMFLNSKCYGQLKSQHEDINHEVQVSSNDTVVDLNERSIELAQNGNLKEAERIILEALKIEPYNYVLIANYGNIKSNLTESIKLMDKAYKLSDSTYHVAGSNLSRLYSLKNEYDKGVKIATYVIQNSENDINSYTAYFHRIVNYLGLNKCNEARKDFEFLKRNFKHFQNSERHLKKIQSIIDNTCID
jgi:tetratricopeptide (TPR) repeat protein